MRRIPKMNREQQAAWQTAFVRLMKYKLAKARGASGDWELTQLERIIETMADVIDRQYHGRRG